MFTQIPQHLIVILSAAKDLSHIIVLSAKQNAAEKIIPPRHLSFIKIFSNIFTGQISLFHNR